MITGHVYNSGSTISVLVLSTFIFAWKLLLCMCVDDQCSVSLVMVELFPMYTGWYKEQELWVTGHLLHTCPSCRFKQDWTKQQEVNKPCLGKSLCRQGHYGFIALWKQIDNSPLGEGLCIKYSGHFRFHDIHFSAHEWGTSELVCSSLVHVFIFRN